MAQGPVCLGALLVEKHLGVVQAGFEVGGGNRRTLLEMWQKSFCHILYGWLAVAGEYFHHRVRERAESQFLRVEPTRDERPRPAPAAQNLAFYPLDSRAQRMARQLGQIGKDWGW